ncbi:MAG: response regulator [Verrucomicrobiales bacterium]|nr:response regulator [Verrucomicrobiales bacterium]
MRRVLIVDDDVPFRERLARALEQRGISCGVAADGAGAVRWVEEHDLDGVVLDLRMPAYSGLDLLAALVRRRPGLSVVLLTAYGSIATALEAVRLGARDFLIKPADADTILAALEGRRPQREMVPPEVPSLDRVEWEHIGRVLADCGGNISQAARLLGLDRRTLQRKLAKFPPRH